MKICTVVAALALLSACSSSSSAPPIAGKLTVHTGIEVKDGGSLTARVLIGDGTKFNQPVDANGDVVFQDGALQGAQTVTVVESDGQSDSAITIVGINRDEIWFPGSSAYAPSTVLGTVSGGVTGIADAGDYTSVTLVGPAYGYGAANGGAFSFQVYGPDGGVDGGVGALLAEEQSPTFDTVKVGLRQNVPLGGDVTGQDVALDHAVDQIFTLTVPNASTFGSTVNAALTYQLGTEYLFSSSGQGPSPVNVPAIARTAPFDATTLVASVTVGNRGSLPNGKIEQSSAETGTSATLTLPAPLTVTSPALGTPSSPPTVSVAGLKLAWTADPNAQVALLELYDSNLDWLVMAPASTSDFTFFPLPSNASTVTGFSGPATLDASELRQDGFNAFEDYFAQDSNQRSDQVTNYWQTEVRGRLTLQ